MTSRPSSFRRWLRASTLVVVACAGSALLFHDSETPAWDTDGHDHNHDAPAWSDGGTESHDGGGWLRDRPHTRDGWHVIETDKETCEQVLNIPRGTPRNSILVNIPDNFRVRDCIDHYKCDLGEVAPSMRSTWLENHRHPGIGNGRGDTDAHDRNYLVSLDRDGNGNFVVQPVGVTADDLTCDDGPVVGPGEFAPRITITLLNEHGVNVTDRAEVERVRGLVRFNPRGRRNTCSNDSHRFGPGTNKPTAEVLEARDPDGRRCEYDVVFPESMAATGSDDAYGLILVDGQPARNGVFGTPRVDENNPAASATYQLAGCEDPANRQHLGYVVSDAAVTATTAGLAYWFGPRRLIGGVWFGGWGEPMPRPVWRFTWEGPGVGVPVDCFSGYHFTLSAEFVRVGANAGRAWRAPSFGGQWTNTSQSRDVSRHWLTSPDYSGTYQANVFSLDIGSLNLNWGAVHRSVGRIVACRGPYSTATNSYESCGGVDDTVTTGWSCPPSRRNPSVAAERSGVVIPEWVAAPYEAALADRDASRQAREDGVARLYDWCYGVNPPFEPRVIIDVPGDYRPGGELAGSASFPVTFTKRAGGGCDVDVDASVSRVFTPAAVAGDPATPDREVSLDGVCVYSVDYPGSAANDALRLDTARAVVSAGDRSTWARYVAATFEPDVLISVPAEFRPNPSDVLARPCSPWSCFELTFTPNTDAAGCATSNPPLRWRYRAEHPAVVGPITGPVSGSHPQLTAACAYDVGYPPSEQAAHPRLRLDTASVVSPVSAADPATSASYLACGSALTPDGFAADEVDDEFDVFDSVVLRWVPQGVNGLPCDAGFVVRATRGVRDGRLVPGHTESTREPRSSALPLPGDARPESAPHRRQIVEVWPTNDGVQGEKMNVELRRCSTLPELTPLVERRGQLIMRADHGRVNKSPPASPGGGFRPDRKAVTVDADGRRWAGDALLLGGKNDAGELVDEPFRGWCEQQACDTPPAPVAGLRVDDSPAGDGVRVTWATPASDADWGGAGCVTREVTALFAWPPAAPVVVDGDVVREVAFDLPVGGWQSGVVRVGLRSSNFAGAAEASWLTLYRCPPGEFGSGAILVGVAGSSVGRLASPPGGALIDAGDAGEFAAACGTPSCPVPEFKALWGDLGEANKYGATDAGVYDQPKLLASAAAGYDHVWRESQRERRIEPTAGVLDFWVPDGWIHAGALYGVFATRGQTLTVDGCDYTLDELDVEVYALPEERAQASFYDPPKPWLFDERHYELWLPYQHEFTRRYAREARHAERGDYPHLPGDDTVDSPSMWMRLRRYYTLDDTNKAAYVACRTTTSIHPCLLRTYYDWHMPDILGRFGWPYRIAMDVTLTNNDTGIQHQINWAEPVILSVVERSRLRGEAAGGAGGAVAERAHLVSGQMRRGVGTARERAAPCGSEECSV